MSRQVLFRSAVLMLMVALAVTPAWAQATQPATQAAATGPAGGPPQAFRFAAITDTHIASAEELATFRALLHTMADEKVDFLLILGDICGQAPEYLPQIREVIDHGRLKVYVIPGNHDDNYGRNSEWFSEVWPRSQYTFDHKGWRFVMNDSQRIVNTRDEAAMAWLRRQLASLPAGMPAIVCQHYPPSVSRQDGPDPAADVTAELTRSSGVKIVLAGHEHRRRTFEVGRISCEVLENCFLQDQNPKDPARYYIVETAADGRVHLTEHELKQLKLREPADRVPTVDIEQPEMGAILAGETVFAGTASDDRGVQAVEYSVNFGRWQRAQLREPNNWRFTFDTRTLPDTHHTIRVRAVDSAGQPSIMMDSVIALVENEPSPNGTVFRFQQGRNGYDGCRDVTVRRDPAHKAASGEDGAPEDLECWIFRSRGGELVEFNEFYIRFDLSKTSIPKDAKIRRATLTLYGSRQNKVDPEGRLCGYRVAALDVPWQADMTFARRPAEPGWLGEPEDEPAPAMTGTWPYLGGRQLVIPPREVVIDLAPLKDRIEGWLRDPGTNHGLVFSPAPGSNYNMSAKGSRCEIATLRPRLEIEIEPPRR